MAYKKQYKKKNYKGRRRNRRRQNKKNKPTTTIMKSIGVADMLYVKLNYVDTIKISNASLPYFTYVFRGNSLFDPDFTGTGHQPLYYDQYSLLYARYRVLASSIKLDVINNSGNGTMYYVAEPNTDTTGTTSVSVIYEQSRASAPKIVSIAARLGSRMKRYASTRKVCGLTKSQLYDDTFAALTSTNPGNVWYWNLLFESVDQSTEVIGYFIIKITYYCQFFDRIFAAQS